MPTTEIGDGNLKMKRNNLFMRIFIILLGILFILWGSSLVTLGFVGKSNIATITNVKREGGERNEGIGGRYLYNISYTFKIPNGKSIDGFTKKIGSGTYIKNPNTITTIKYFDFFPYINALAEDTKIGLKQVIYIGIGVLLIYSGTRKGD